MIVGRYQLSGMNNLRVADGKTFDKNADCFHKSGFATTRQLRLADAETLSDDKDGRGVRVSYSRLPSADEPANTFRPSANVTLRALAIFEPSFAR